jgi:hypothetical protein
MVVVLCVMGLAVLAIDRADAAFVYVNCTLSECGTVTNGANFIVVTDTSGAPAFPANTTLILDNTNLHGKEMLAAALTAYSVRWLFGVVGHCWAIQQDRRGDKV